MADQIRVAIVGAGYFGRFHADHYSRNPRAKLIAVVDTSAERASAVAAETDRSKAVELPQSARPMVPGHEKG